MERNSQNNAFCLKETPSSVSKEIENESYKEGTNIVQVKEYNITKNENFGSPASCSLQVPIHCSETANEERTHSRLKLRHEERLQRR